eukprot:6182078-Pleurochrysis_carterae.AAC.1
MASPLRTRLSLQPLRATLPFIAYPGAIAAHWSRGKCTFKSPEDDSAPTVAIDTSGLASHIRTGDGACGEEHTHASGSNENPVQRQLCSQIRFGGPISVAEFMNTALTHPQKGYYMQRDVFGSKGDFTTSPE